MTTSRRLLNVHRTIDGAHEAIASDRREFVEALGFAVLTVLSLPRLVHASGSLPNQGDEGTDSLTIHSSPGLVSHVHDLLIPFAVLKAPPRQGVELATTQALLHRHNIVLTQEQLIVVNQGGRVTKKASSHFFVIALATRQDHAQAGSTEASRGSE